MTNLSHEARQAAIESLIESYSDYLADSGSIRFTVEAKYAALAAKQIEQETFEAKARLGRAIARSPLTVREKQRLTKSTNWGRYREFIEASGEVDVSSRQGRLQQNLETLKSEMTKNTDSAKTESAKTQVPTKNVTAKMREWEHYEAMLTGRILPVTEEAEWYETEPVPGGESRLWAVEPDGKIVLGFTVPAGDDDWESVSQESDGPRWDSEREAVKSAFDLTDTF